MNTPNRNAGEGSRSAKCRHNRRFQEPFTFDSDATISDWEICHETYGKPNADMSNAVLVCPALSGSQHAAGYHDAEAKTVGWWDNFIGPGKPLDTNRFFVVSPNNLGGCHGDTSNIFPFTKPCIIPAKYRTSQPHAPKKEKNIY